MERGPREEHAIQRARKRMMRATGILALAGSANGLQIAPASCGHHRALHLRPRPRRHHRSTALHLLKGLEPSVDDDIKREIEDANMSNFQVFQRELEEGASLPAAFQAMMRRRKDKAGDYENKYKILSDYRSYSNRELLDTDHFDLAPTLDDLNQQQPDKGKVVWVTSPYRLLVFLGSFWFFPYLCTILSTLVEISEDEFDIINDQFTPGIGILYGTFVALTLDILYERQGKVQENASVEASLLSQVTQNVLNLFRDEVDIAREATQIIADQVRIIVYRPRGAEMLNIMRADPYARLLSIVDHYQRDRTSFTPHQESLIDNLRGEIPALMEARAKRLSDEASALPPTHFLVLLILTALSLIGFTAATLTITNDEGQPPLESRMVFAGLSAVYVLFFNFCKDMNDPFDGVYQIKRSSAASYLLQIKWLIANQPFGKDIKFDTRGLAPVYDGNEVVEIGKGARKIDASEASEKVDSQQQVATTTVKEQPVSNGAAVHPDLERLHQMKEELSGLKQLHGQIANGVQASHGHTNGSGSALENSFVSSKTQVAEKALADAMSAQMEQSKALTEAKISPLKDKATGVSFDGKLEDGLYLVGVGVRKKAIINVYAVAMYSSPSALETLSPFPRGKQAREAQAALRNAARTFDASSPKTSFVLQMTFKADAETIAGAIADSVKPRYTGPAADVKELEALISEGVKSKGGQATKGTVFRFDCTKDGVSVSVDGKLQGAATFEGMGSAFVDVFMDDKAVSLQLVSSCLDTWCGSNIHTEMEEASKNVERLQKQLEEARAEDEKAPKVAVPETSSAQAFIPERNKVPADGNVQP